MFAKLLGKKKPYKEIQASSNHIAFLGEPTGNGVIALKMELAKILAAEGNITRAYLSKIQYSGEEKTHLALLLEAKGPQEQTARAVAQGCAPLGSVDILFCESLPQAAVQSLREIVSPFFPVANTGNSLFLINLKVGRGSNPDMPPDSSGAYVAVFVAAADSEAAAKAAVAHISKLGYEFLDVADKKIHQLDPLGWGAYIEEAWPEYRTHFPMQGDVIAGIPFGNIFFGPFACYSEKAAQQGAQADSPASGGPAA